MRRVRDSGYAGEMLLKIGVVVLVLVVAVVAIALSKPSVFRIERSLVIHATPAQIFPLLNDFHAWPSWAPQDREDPTMKRTYAGAPAGVGAISTWTSTGNAGEGTVTVLESAPDQKLVVQTDFVKPFTARNINRFTLEPQGADATKITWSMEGPNLFPMRLMGVFVNMDKMMGAHFESGLANLSSAAASR